MTKKIVKKRKIKVFNLLLVLLIPAALSFGIYFSLQIPIQGIVLKNTNYLNDDDILELAGIKDYPSFFLTSGKEIENKLKKSPYIYKVKLLKKLNFTYVLNIRENRPLFLDTNQNKYVFDTKETVKEENVSFRVPRLLNYIPDNKNDKFIDSMKIVEESVLSKISDIEYQPNDYDKDRFLLYMDDGNMVYLTLTKFKMINHYNDVLSQLENHKGILYLDNGNHFQIKE